ncbi:MAG: hypothetical protein ACREB6_00880, partial [Rhodospirillales bacterium]
ELSLLPRDWRDRLIALPGRLRQRLASSTRAAGERLKTASFALRSRWRDTTGGGKTENTSGR